MSYLGSVDCVHNSFCHHELLMSKIRCLANYPYLLTRGSFNYHKLIECRHLKFKGKTSRSLEEQKCTESGEPSQSTSRNKLLIVTLK